MSDRVGFVGWGEGPWHRIAVRDPASVVQQRWVIGQAEDCDVRVSDRYVSGHHCQGCDWPVADSWSATLAQPTAPT